ncbi:AAA family ATPase [Chitinophagaceae bacterium LWZ2-11]
MIEKITIQKCATYNETGCSIENFNKINFIYGTNGTGKTTISNFVKNPTQSIFQSCNIKWENNTAIDTLVYNKIFREENFSSGKINGVFTLGKATKEEVEEIETKTQEKNKITDEGKQKKDTLEKQEEVLRILEDKFREELWIKLYKKNEKNFKEAMRGFIGSKEAFKNKILFEFKPTPQSILTLDELLEKSDTIFSDILPTPITTITNVSGEEINKIGKELIWNKVIIGKSDVEISKLIHKLNIDDWVNEGRDYIQENICPFCQKKTITEEFKNQIENYFDEIYLKELDQIKNFRDTYKIKSENNIALLENIEINQKTQSNSKLNIDLYSSYLKTLSQQLKSNQNKLDTKLKEPSRKLQLEQTEHQFELLNKIINEANEEIEKHNDIVKNYEREKDGLIKNAWIYLVEEFRNEITDFLKKKEGLQKGIIALSEQLKKKREEFQKIDQEIKTLSQNITDIQPTIDEINKLLRYYGFLNFQIVKANEDGFYQVQREDGTFAHHTLSEGEITFITFLYFLQLVKGSINKNNITNDRIVVIDDPISSLDSNILFVVSTLVKNIIDDIKEEKGCVKQLILLTHNVYFHKEVSFIDCRKDKSSKVHYWILRKNGTTSNIQSYGITNPIQSSYSLLWEEFKNETITSSVSVQNIMRRIIENYFKLLGKYGDDKLINKFDIKEEREICKSLISWINDGSHSINDDLFIEAPAQTINIFKKVFKDIFEKTNHIAHYNMMMGIEE